MKAVLLSDNIHEKLKEISKSRKETDNYCRNLRDIVQVAIYKIWQKECEK